MYDDLEAVREIRREYYQNRVKSDPTTRRRYQVSAIKSRSKAKGIPCDIEYEDVEWPEYCPLLEMKLDYSAGIGNPASPSVDRKVPELGYIKGNVWVISKRANSMKHDASIEELKIFCKNLQLTLLKE